MSTDFEQRLGASLRTATDLAAPDYPALDPATVIDQGSRLVRRRRLVRGAATLAVAAALVAAAGSLAPGHREAVPAAPTPGPIVSATLGQEGAFELDGKAVPGPSRFVVEAEPKASGPNVRYYAVGPNGRRTLLAGADVDFAGSAATWGTGSGASHVLIGVMPATATDYTLVATATAGGWAGDRASLTGTGFQAFLAVFGDSADVGKVTGLVWIDGSHVVHDGQGTTLPSATTPDGATAFLSESLDTMGVFRTGSVDTTSLSGRSAGGKPSVPAIGSATTLSDGRESTTFVAVVAWGATAPQVGYAADCTHPQTPTLYPAGDGAHAFLGTTCVRPKGATGKAITSYTVTVDGKPITVRP